jgi:hypothetical protein
VEHSHGGEHALLRDPASLVRQVSPRFAKLIQVEDEADRDAVFIALGRKEHARAPPRSVTRNVGGSVRNGLRDWVRRGEGGIPQGGIPGPGGCRYAQPLPAGACVLDLGVRQRRPLGGTTPDLRAAHLSESSSPWRESLNGAWEAVKHAVEKATGAEGAHTTRRP